jgi:hypothetical protein
VVSRRARSRKESLQSKGELAIDRRARNWQGKLAIGRRAPDTVLDKSSTSVLCLNLQCVTMAVSYASCMSVICVVVTRAIGTGKLTRTTGTIGTVETAMRGSAFLNHDAESGTNQYQRHATLWGNYFVVIGYKGLGICVASLAVLDAS